MTRTYHEGQYVITASGDDFWNATAAKTLTGAKTVASKTYQQSVGGKIEVAVVVGSGDQQRFEQVAVKHGFDSWQTA